MIQTRGLAKRFGPKTAVQPLDLDVAEGEFFCFLGPNGAGKTTTIKMLTGLRRPSGGSALLGGHDIQRDPISAKQLLGYIPDHPFLYERLTGRELMRFVAGLYSLPEETFEQSCDDLLETFELSHAADQLVETYSHGMRQKLSFASCFLHQPRIVVVDEPWVGLDPKNIRSVKTYLRDKTRQGLTVFMSTHSLQIAEELADRIGIIHRGRLLHVGTVDEIKSLASAAAGSLEDVFLQLTREAEEEE
ncbi:MAG: ABC transporter ATP-binding protein [bacterium]|nr:ABC transporter ATP-binding protein [bacterium]